MRSVHHLACDLAIESGQRNIEQCRQPEIAFFGAEIDFASMAVSAGRATFILSAATFIAPMKQADQPTANNCLGFSGPCWAL